MPVFPSTDPVTEAVNDEADVTWANISWLEEEGNGTVLFRFPPVPEANGIDWDSLVTRLSYPADNYFNVAPRAYFGVTLEPSPSIYSTVQLAATDQVEPGDGPIDLNRVARRDEDDAYILNDNEELYIAALQAGEFTVMLDFPSMGPLIVGHYITLQVHRVYMTYLG